MQNEIWKDISEFAGYYQISNMGRVKRIADYSNQNKSWKLKEPKILKPRLHNNGYLRVMLSVNGKHYDRYIHRLEAIEFLDNPNNYGEINHIDGDKTNNNLGNIEWCNRSYNNKHAYQNGLRVVKGCYGNKKKVAQVSLVENSIINIFNSIKEAALSVSCNQCMITNCCNERTKSCRGFKWVYATEDMKVGDVVDRVGNSSR